MDRVRTFPELLNSVHRIHAPSGELLEREEKEIPHRMERFPNFQSERETIVTNEYEEEWP
jgi:hypothetical protein